MVNENNFIQLRKILYTFVSKCPSLQLFEITNEFNDLQLFLLG
jgi:hypothetical protein